jgi:hypothetical protein
MPTIGVRLSRFQSVRNEDAVNFRLNFRHLLSRELHPHLIDQLHRLEVLQHVFEATTLKGIEVKDTHGQVRRIIVIFSEHIAPY